MKQSDLLKSPKNWVEDFNNENGNYMNTCRCCKQHFLGYKRRIECKECVERQKIGELLPGEHPDEIYPRAESWLAERRNWIKEVDIMKKEIQRLTSLVEKS